MSSLNALLKLLVLAPETDALLFLAVGAAGPGSLILLCICQKPENPSTCTSLHCTSLHSACSVRILVTPKDP
ncbi:hypothetical protein PR002_g25431 [Phytophthora rubi]|uniref:RxLR effector protein n=1 Tax=Phytophthora rubi TaxID=129364 RepID=A0A6A3HZF2_9STRA|nr:hypothetical protein PR002_g25431 [Phytophthora rubi]